MRYLNIVLTLTITILITACTQENPKTKLNKLNGLWSLQIMEQQDSVTGQWNEWRNGMQGYILYDNAENMALHLTTKGYQDTDMVFPNFNDTISNDALKHLTGSYVYFAKYSVDEKESIVQHSRISHSNPSMWNQIVRRRFSFSGDTLILQPVEKTLSGLRLKWIKG